MYPNMDLYTISPGLYMRKPKKMNAFDMKYPFTIKVDKDENECLDVKYIYESEKIPTIITKIKFITELNEHDRIFTIRIRILHIYDRIDRADDSFTPMLVVDKSKKRIYVYVKNWLQHGFRVNMVYDLSKGIVAHDEVSMWEIKRRVSICIFTNEVSGSTLVRDDYSIGYLRYKHSDISSYFSPMSLSNEYKDLVGILLSYEVEEINTVTGQTYRSCLLIADSPRVRIEVIMWDNVESLMPSGNPHPIIMIQNAWFSGFKTATYIVTPKSIIRFNPPLKRPFELTYQELMEDTLVFTVSQNLESYCLSLQQVMQMKTLYMIGKHHTLPS
jgi:hypothetical protein